MAHSIYFRKFLPCLGCNSHFYHSPNVKVLSAFNITLFGLEQCSVAYSQLYCNFSYKGVLPHCMHTSYENKGLQLHEFSLLLSSVGLKLTRPPFPRILPASGGKSCLFPLASLRLKQCRQQKVALVQKPKSWDYGTCRKYSPEDAVSFSAPTPFRAWQAFRELSARAQTQ